MALSRKPTCRASRGLIFINISALIGLSLGATGCKTISATFGEISNLSAKDLGIPFVPAETPPPASLSLSSLSFPQGFSGEISSGASTILTLTTRASDGSQLSVGGHVVVFTTSLDGTSTGTFSSVVDNHDGTYSSTFTGVLAGTPTSIQATVDGNALTSAPPAVKVVPGPISLSESIVTVSSDEIPSTSTSILTLVSHDMNGNLIPTGGATVVFSHNGGTSTGIISATTDNGDGTYSAAFTGIVAGTATNIQATIDGEAVTHTPPSITVVPDSTPSAQSVVTVSASSIQSGSNATLTLTVVDANGNQLSSGGLVVAFSYSGGSSSGVIGTTTDNGNGTYSATFTGVTAGTATSIHATIGGNAVTSTAPSITVTPGPLSLSQSEITASTNTVVSGADVVLTLTAKDANGNLLTSGGGTVVFSHSGGTSTGIIGAVTDLLNGTYTATFTGVLAGTATTIHATVNGNALTSSAPTISVSPGPISLSESFVTVSDSEVPSSSTSTLTVVTQDMNGNLVPTGGATVVFSNTGGTSTGTISATTDNGDGTYTAVFTGILAGTATTIQATINGGLITSDSPTITVVPDSTPSAQSAVTASASSIQSGSDATLTLTTIDANGNRLNSGGFVVVFSYSGGTSTGTISATTDNGDGTYTATFTGVTAGTATSIHATIGGNAVTSTAPTLTVTPGPLSLSQSQITTSANTVVSGNSIVLTLTAKDANGNQLSSGGGTVVFSRSGGTSTGVFGAVTDLLNGTYTATFTGVAVGTATSIGATFNGQAITSSSPSVTVTAGAASLSQSSVTSSLGSAGSLVSGSTATLTFTARDSNGNQLSTGGLTIVFSNTGGTSTGTFGPVVDRNDGTYTTTFTGVTAGTATSIQATLNGDPVTSSAPTILVVAGPFSLSQSQIAVSASSVASGANITVTLTAKDANGNQLPSGGATVVFSRSGGTSTGVFGAVTDNLNGTYTATFTGMTAGTSTSIGATYNGQAITSSSPSVTVTAGAVSLSQSSISSSLGSGGPSDQLASGANATLTLTAKDANGNRLPTGGLTVVFSNTGGTSTGTFGSVVDHNDGTYTTTFTGLIAGTATSIHVTINGSSVTSTKPLVTVIPGAVSLSQSTVEVSADSIASGSDATLTLITRDSNGNLIQTGGSTVVFSYLGGTSTGTVSATTDNADGTYEATFTGNVAGTATTIGATVNGNAITSTLPTIVVVANNTTTAQSIVSVSSSSVTSGDVATLTLTAIDGNGNPLSTGGLTVVFSRTGGTSTGTISATTDNGDGTYTATFTGIVAGTPTTIRATINGSLVTSSPPTITVTPDDASLSQSIVTVSSSSIRSGSTSLLTLTTRDPNGNALTSGGLLVAFSYSGGVSTGTISAVTDNGNGTYTATFTGATAGSATIIHATIGGNEVTSTLPSITVTPNLVSLSQSSISSTSGPAGQIASGTSATLTLTARDSNGNQLSTGGLVVVFSTLGGTSTGTFGSVTDHNDGTYTATFTGVLSGSATSIQATVDGDALTSSAPTITVVPGSASVSQSQITVSANTVAYGSSVDLTLIARDLNGNALTSGGAAVVFSFSGGTSVGAINSTSDNDDGSYTASFTGVTAGTPTTIHATLGGAEVTSTLPTVTVIPGNLSLSESTLSLSSGSSGQVVSGQSITCTLTARDSNGNQFSSGGYNVVFSNTGGTSTGTFGSVVDNQDGTYTTTFTGVISGSATSIQATVDDDLLTSTPPTVKVIPGSLSLSGSVVTVSSSVVASSATATIILTVQDSNGNRIRSGGSTVTFSHTGGTSSGSISATTDNGDGTYTAIFTGILAGTATSISASINGNAITSALPTITVAPSDTSAAQSLVSASANTVTSGTTALLTFTAKDANGNQLATGGLDVIFSNVGGTSTGSFSPTTDNGDGTYTSTFTGVDAGTATTIHVTFDGTEVVSTLPQITVTPAVLSTAESLITVSSASILSGSTSTLTLTVKDTNGNLLPSGGHTVVFSYAGGTSTGVVSATTDNEDGTYTATLTGIMAGSPTTIHATIDGSAVTSTLPTITVNPGPASVSQSVLTASVSTLASGSQATLTLITKDSNSNPLTSGGLAVSFSFSGGTSTGALSATNDNGNGIYTATFTGLVAGSATTINATLNGNPITSTHPTVTVIESDASPAFSVVTVSSSSIVSGSTATLTLTTKDSKKNNLTLGGLNVSFGLSNGTSSGTISEVTDNGNGTYTAIFTGVTAGTATTITSSFSGTAVTSTLPTITVLPGPVSVSQSTITVSPSSIRFNTVSNLKLMAKDANGNSLTTGGLTVVFTKTGGTSTGTISSTTNVGNGTYTATFTGTLPGTPTTIGATIGGVAVTSTLPTITVVGANLEVPIEMIDGGIASVTSSTTYETSKTNLNTTLYDGTITYLFEVIAYNTDSVSRSISLLNSSGTTVGTLTVPNGSTSSSPVRIRASFTPTAGANSYRLRLTGTTSTGQLGVYSARILVQQVNATKTRLYFPLLVGAYNTVSSTIPAAINSQTSTTYGQSSALNFQRWTKDTSKLATLPSTNPWQFDAIIWSSSNSKNCYASLYTTGGTQVSSSAVNSSSTSPGLKSASFSNSATGFTNLSTFTVQTRIAQSSQTCYIAKAGLWVTLTSVSKGESYYRVDKMYNSLGSSFISANGRILLDLSLFNSSNVNVYYETTGFTSAGASTTLSLDDVGVADSGSSSAIGITGCSLSAANLGTSIAVRRSSACSGITNGDRLINEFIAGSGTVSTSGTFAVVSFQ